MFRPNEWQYGLRNVLRRGGIEIARTREISGFHALHLSKLFTVCEPDVVLDVGARIGEFGLWARRNGYRGRIISFEPVSSNYEALARRASGDGRWDVYNYALGAEEGESDINVTQDSMFSSLLMPNAYAEKEFGSGARVSRTERVGVRRLDAVFEEVVAPLKDPRVFLKMDTQGWDLQVLAGADGFLSHIVAFQSEVSVQAIYEGMPNLAASLAEFERRGFAISGLFPVNLDSQLRVVEFDCVVVRDDRR